jgi:hypothetical protein
MKRGKIETSIIFIITNTLTLAADKLKRIFRGIENFSTIVYGPFLEDIRPYMILQAIDDLATTSAVEDIWRDD